MYRLLQVLQWSILLHRRYRAQNSVRGAAYQILFRSFLSILFSLVFFLPSDTPLNSHIRRPGLLFQTRSLPSHLLSSFSKQPAWLLQPLHSEYPLSLLEYLITPDATRSSILSLLHHDARVDPKSRAIVKSRTGIRVTRLRLGGCPEQVMAPLSSGGPFARPSGNECGL